MTVSFVAPELAKLVDKAPEGDGWLHEMKFDGYRILARKDGRDVTLRSRRDQDWTRQFPTVRDAIAALPAKVALLDGEVAVVMSDGRTSFQALQNAFGGAPPAGLTYFVFDLLHLDGEDLRGWPLERRKARLRELVDGAPAVIQYSDHVVGQGGAFFRTACERGLEGIISKKRDEPYTSGRRGGWLKIKCIQRQELVIGGFTEPSSGAGDGLGALLVGHYRDGALVYAGKVGTGFTQASARELRAKLDRLEQDRCPFGVVPRGWVGANAHWVRPELVAEVAFSEWTADGRLRHPSFQGLRRDKAARGVVRETSDRPIVAGVKISNADRVMYPARGLTKLDLARYLEEVSPWMLPQVVGRPLTLVQCPKGLDGGCHYMRHAKAWGPDVLRRVPIREKTKVGQYLVVDDLAGLIALAQLDILEIHTWNSTTDHLEQPDRIVMDLDPGPAVAWKDVVAAAREVRAAFAALGLDTLVKTTGGAGLHVVVPIIPEHDVATCLAYARGFAEALVAARPGFTTKFDKQGRDDKILLDYLRNNRTNTSVAAYSMRAKPTAPVSVPLAWDELSARKKSDAFTVENVRRRLRGLREDPWGDWEARRQRLSITGSSRASPAPPSRASPPR